MITELRDTTYFADLHLKSSDGVVIVSSRPSDVALQVDPKNELLQHARIRRLQGEAIRDALLATQGVQGAEGMYRFDQNGDGLHGYNVVRNDKGNIVFDRRIDFYQG